MHNDKSTMQKTIANSQIKKQIVKSFFKYSLIKSINYLEFNSNHSWLLHSVTAKQSPMQKKSQMKRHSMAYKLTKPLTLAKDWIQLDKEDTALEKSNSISHVVSLFEMECQHHSKHCKNICVTYFSTQTVYHQKNEKKIFSESR